MNTNSSNKSITVEIMESQAFGWTKKLPSILRGFGAIAVLVSLYSFMMRGWDSSSDLIRYSMLLGHTGMLAVIALISGHFLNEGKGPRLLLMLALVAVSINFSILGGFILSTMNITDMAVYPTYVAWEVDSFATAMMILAGAMVILLPVILTGFLTLARGMSTQMSGLFLLSNAAILLPIRDPVSISVLSLLLGSLLLLITAKNAHQRNEVKTYEGVVALLLQFLPIGLLLGRNVWLYPPSVALYTASSLICFMALRQYSKLTPESSLFRIPSELSSSIFAIIAGFSLGELMIQSDVSSSLATIMGSTLAAALCYEISLRSHFKRCYRIMAMLTVSGGLLTNLMVNGGVLASVSCIILGAGLVIWSLDVRQRSILLGGIVTSGAGALDQFQHVFHYFDFNYWIAMAALGVIAIVLASVLESKGNAIKNALITYRARFSEWSY